MKQKIYISWFTIRLGLISLLISAPQLLCAQELNDSTRITLDGLSPMPKGILQVAPIKLSPKKTILNPLYSSKKLSGQMTDFTLKDEIRLPYQVNPSLLFKGDYRTSGIFKQFPHGALFGSGGQTSMAGIGRFNNATFGYQHIFSDKLSLEARVNAMKINMSHITGQAFSTSGTFFYRPSERVTLKFFGSYDIGNSYGMSSHNYGATMAFDMTERFGMEMGVQRYYDAMRGRWETVPVVIPYYRFEKFNLGMDVGGILFEILRQTVFEKRGGGSTTIAPPRLSIPVIR